MRAVIIVGPANYKLDELYHPMPEDFIIGADIGALILSQQKMTFDVAIGDFDSIGEHGEKLVDQYANEVIKYSTIKDETDSFLAVQEALKRGYNDILIIGGIGGRFDHSYANLHLLLLGNISIQTRCEYMYVLSPGEHTIQNAHKYISFFALENVKNLSLQGFFYESHVIDLPYGNPLCISNQGSGILSFSEGTLLVIHQNEMKKALD